jgi:hypothetical protein
LPRKISHICPVMVLWENYKSNPGLAHIQINCNLFQRATLRISNPKSGRLLSQAVYAQWEK